MYTSFDPSYYVRVLPLGIVDDVVEVEVKLRRETQIVLATCNIWIRAKQQNVSCDMGKWHRGRKRKYSIIYRGRNGIPDPIISVCVYHVNGMDS